MTLPELVIFDCDGVLVDSEVISNAVLAQALSGQGLRTTLAEARRDYQGLLLGEVVARAERLLGRSLPPGWLAEYERERAAVFRRELRPVAGAGETVRRSCRGRSGSSEGALARWWGILPGRRVGNT